MNEGWHGDDYLILFDESEIKAVSDSYALAKLLPGFELLGLVGWDDFIVRDLDGKTYSVPTVPVDPEYFSAFTIPKELKLISDPRFEGKIKWHVKPIVFGGDPNVGDNLKWLNQEQHAQLVKWWNDKYRSLKVNGGSTNLK